MASSIIVSNPVSSAVNQSSWNASPFQVADRLSGAWRTLSEFLEISPV